jgi:3',5'-cyclic AMP phosphodiesterase CpdA
MFWNALSGARVKSEHLTFLQEASMKRLAAVFLFGLVLAATAVAADDTMPPLVSLKGTPTPDPPKDPDKFVFIVTGDNRPAEPTDPPTDTVKEIFQKIAQQHPAFVLWTGDIVYGKMKGESKKKEEQVAEEYQKFLDLASGGGAAVYNAPGNHEMNNKENCPTATMMKLYLENAGQNYPYGWFDYGHSRFIALNTDESAPKGDPCSCESQPGEDKPPGYISKKQMELLEEELKDAKKADMAHIFLFMHRPIKGYDGKDQLCAENVTRLEKLFADYPNLSYVVAGHQHMYYNAQGKGKQEFCAPPERTDPAKAPFYLVSGGAGAPLKKNDGGFYHYLIFTVDHDKVSVTLVRLDQNDQCKPSSVAEATHH